MKIKQAIPSLLIFSLDKWRYLVTSLLLFSFLSLISLSLDTKWLFIQYCIVFSSLFIIASVYCRSYFDELHHREKNIFQTFLQSRKMVLRLSLYLLFFLLLGFCIVGFGSLMQKMSQAPVIGRLLHPLTMSLFFIIKFVEVLFTALFVFVLFILAPMASFRLEEINRWPQFVYERIFKQNNNLVKGFFIGILPLFVIVCLLIATLIKTQMPFFSFPILFISSFMLAPFFNFFFASSCFFHLHFAYLIESKEQKS